MLLNVEKSRNIKTKSKGTEASQHSSDASAQLTFKICTIFAPIGRRPLQLLVALVYAYNY